MPGSIKLTYFPLPGRAEPARLCFVYSGIAFEDKRIPFDEWGQMKAALSPDEYTLYKLSSLPWLEVDGEEISQSMAVTRYAAALAGLDGKNSKEKAKVDMVLCSFAELINGCVKLFSAPEDKADEIRESVMKTFKTNVDALEKMLKENNGGKTWTVGDAVTVADFAIYGFLVQVEFLLSKMEKSAATEFDIPCLVALKQRVAELPKLQEYIAKANES